jgi:regulatory protein YycI of two-component signal transduction system YycFG
MLCVVAKGRKISKANYLISSEQLKGHLILNQKQFFMASHTPKKQQKISHFFSLVSKMDQIKKKKSQLFLISVLNIIKGLYFFNLTPFRDWGKKM